MSSPIAVVLAAGAGTRFAGPDHKLLAALRGRPVVRHAVDHAVASGLDVVVVQGAVDLTPVLADLVADGRVTLVDNDRWADGQATSAHVAFAAARARGADAVVIALGDQPFIEPSAWTALARCDADAAVATYDGRRGHPVRLGASTWPDVPTEGDDVGRVVLARRQASVREIGCDGSPIDIDTTEELSRWS